MKKKRVLKITPVLVTLNILVLFAIAIFYTCRLIKYYKLENARNDDGTILLVDELKKKRSYLDETKGLVFNEDENIYRYKGEVKDNYIYYSGMMYRILGIDKDENIRAISEENVTLLYPGFENGYKDSFVTKWLNSSETKYSGVFEESLTSASLLRNTYYCFDKAVDTNNITCEEYNNDLKITLLSLYDYKEAGGKTSFLNNGSQFNLGTLNDVNISYYVTSEGDIAVQPKSNIAILIRPVITFSASTILINGKGTSANPYIVEEHDINTLADVYVGNYVSLNGDAYRVVKVLEDKVLVAKNGVIMKGEEKALGRFGGSNNVYNVSTGMGKYLNNTYLNTLELKDYTVAGEFYTGIVNLNSYDYSLLRASNVKAKVGMLTMGDMFINEVYNILTTFRGIEATNIIYVLNENGYFFGDTTTSEYYVRPAVYLKSDLEISEGDGSLKKPFVLEVKKEDSGE